MKNKKINSRDECWTGFSNYLILFTYINPAETI